MKADSRNELNKSTFINLSRFKLPFLSLSLLLQHLQTSADRQIAYAAFYQTFSNPFMFANKLHILLIPIIILMLLQDNNIQVWRILLVKWRAMNKGIKNIHFTQSGNKSSSYMNNVMPLSTQLYPFNIDRHMESIH